MLTVLLLALCYVAISFVFGVILAGAIGRGHIHFYPTSKAVRVSETDRADTTTSFGESAR